uniref:Uncharacterized protein n=1 Tax=Strigamia maritima TaxID=126957 RepID=T1JHV4_STRMM
MRSARLHRAKSPPRLGLTRSKHNSFPSSCRLAAMARKSSNGLTPLASSSNVTLPSREAYYEESGEVGYI